MAHATHILICNLIAFCTDKDNVYFELGTPSYASVSHFPVEQSPVPVLVIFQFW